MKAFVCEMCGNNQLTKIDGFFQCDYCGTKYTLEEAKKLFVSGTVEVTKGNAEKERLLKNVETLLQLDRFDEAGKLIIHITNEYPDDYRGWFYLYQLSLLRIKGGDCDSIPKSDDSSLESALKLCEDPDFINDFFKNLINEYGSSLHIIQNVKNKTHLYEVFDVNNKLLNLKVIDKLSEWILFSSSTTSDLIKCKEFDDFRKTIAKLYLNEIQLGTIHPAIIEPLTNRDLPELEIKYNYLVLDYLKQYHGLKHFNFPDAIYIGSLSSNITIRYEDIYNTSFSFFGSFVLINRISFLKLPKYITIEEIITQTRYKYRQYNKCQYCGSPFKGVFTKVCSNPKCGKPKDY